MADPKDISFSLATLIQFLSPIIMGIIGVIGWMLKRMIGKIEDSVEAVQCEVDQVRTENKADIKEVKTTIQGIQDLDNSCRISKAEHHAECLDKIGKIGARVAKVEGKMSIGGSHE
jgi:hypothetical protein